MDFHKTDFMLKVRTLMIQEVAGCWNGMTGDVVKHVVDNTGGMLFYILCMYQNNIVLCKSTEPITI